MKLQNSKLLLGISITPKEVFKTSLAEHLTESKIIFCVRRSVKNTVVQIEYEANLEGVVVALTHKPKLLLLGHERNLPPELEDARLGKTASLEFNTCYTYPARDESKILEVDIDRLPVTNPDIGTKFSATDAAGQQLEARVIDAGNGRASVDMNHPRAEN